jgi:hypothetical protein
MKSRIVFISTAVVVAVAFALWMNANNTAKAAAPLPPTTTVSEFATPAATPLPGVWYWTSITPGGNASILSLSGTGGNLEFGQPLPAGAAQLTTNLTNGAKAEVGVRNLYGVASSTIPSLAVGYNWHKASVGEQDLEAAPSIKLTFSNPACDETPGADCVATLVYQPFQNGFGPFPTMDTWQRSDLDLNTGVWSTTGGFGFNGTTGACPCKTLAEWLSESTPDFAQSFLIGVNVSVGDRDPGQTGYFDNVTISGTAFDAIYDFDTQPVVTDGDGDGVPDTEDNCPTTPNPTQTDFDNDGIGDVCDAVQGPPTNKDQCKNNGWKFWTRADGSRFKNQGDCIQYVNTGR